MVRRLSCELAVRASLAMLLAEWLIAPVAFGSPEPAELVKKLLPAVVTLQTIDSAGETLALGSGFILSDGRVVTNAHVVSGCAVVRLISFSGTELGTRRDALFFDQEVDLAVLPAIEDPPGTVDLAAADPPQGTRVLVLGAPQGLSNTVSDGLVSGLREVGGRKLLQISAPISPGSSGGPVLDSEGRLVGISVSSIAEGQNLNFAIPQSALREVLARPSRRVALETTLSHQAPNRKPKRPPQLLERVGRIPEAPELKPETKTSFSLAPGEIMFFNIDGNAGTEVMLRIDSDKGPVDAQVYLACEEPGEFWHSGSIRKGSQIQWRVPILARYWSTLAIRNPASSVEGGNSVKVSLTVERPAPASLISVPDNSESGRDNRRIDKTTIRAGGEEGTIELLVLVPSSEGEGSDQWHMKIDCWRSSFSVLDIAETTGGIVTGSFAGEKGEPLLVGVGTADTAGGWLVVLACDLAMARGLVETPE